MRRQAIGIVAVLAVGSWAARARAADATVSATVPPQCPVGRPAAIEIRFGVPDGSHISPDAPLAIHLSGPASVRFDKTVLHYADAVPPPGAAPHFVIHATPTAAGDQELRIATSYYLCTANLCEMHRKTETVRLSCGERGHRSGTGRRPSPPPSRPEGGKPPARAPDPSVK